MLNRIREMWSPWIHARGVVVGRWWVERDAALRALLPAWPVALIVAVAVFALCITDQGLEAARVSLDLSGAHEQDPWTALLAWISSLAKGQRIADPTYPRFMMFLASLTLFSLTVMASTVFVLSVERGRSLGRHDDDRDPNTPDRRLSQIEPDAIHPSDLLRTRAALVLGLILPAMLSLVALNWRLGGPVVENQWSLLVRIGVAALAGAAVFVALRPIGRSSWINSAQSALRRAYDKRREADPAHPVKPGLWMSAQHGVLEVVRWIAAWPTRRSVALFLALGVFLFIRAPLADGAWITIAQASSLTGLLIVIIVVSAAFHWARRRALRIIQRDHLGPVLVFDRIFARSYRGLSAIIFVLTLLVFWTDVRLEIGPVSIFLLGLGAIMTLLVWLVSRAMSQPFPPAVRRLKPPLLLRPFYHLGGLVERLQGWASPRLIFSIGLTLLLLDWFILPWLERLRGAPAGVMAAALAAAALALPTLIIWGPVLVRNVFGLRKGSIRMASIVIILPFLLLTSGENHHLATLPASPTEPLETAQDHAETWLRRAAAEADPDAPIPAMVVLAEGGGIRAASHIGHLLARMNEQQAAECAKARATPNTPADLACADFYDSVYAVSGVSGGAVGLATYLLAKAESRGDTRDPVDVAHDMRIRIDRTLGRDHLSALFAGMFGSDIPSMFAPAEMIKRIHRLFDPAYEPMRDRDASRESRGWRDRADFFEHSLQEAWWSSRSPGAPADKFSFDNSLEHVALSSARSPERTPIVLFGAFSADDGRMAAASNVRFDDCVTAASTRAVRGLKTVQSCFIDPRAAPGSLESRRIMRTLPLSTAAHLSARFPGSNPPAVVDIPIFATDAATGRSVIHGWRHLRFVDGGYFDNSGGAAASFAIQALFDAADRLDAQSAPASPQSDPQRLDPAAPPPAPRPRLRDRLRVVVLHAYTRSVEDRAPAPTSQSMFTEIVTPLDAILNARSTSGYFPASAFCRQTAGLVQTTAKQAETAAICDGLTDNRTALDYHLAKGRGPMPEVAPANRPLDPAIVTTILDQQADEGRYDVAWINAPLDVAANAESDAGGSETNRPDYRYVLLGWMLQQSAHDYIDRRMCELAPHVLHALRLASRDHDARAGVPPVADATCGLAPSH